MASITMPTKCSESAGQSANTGVDCGVGSLVIIADNSKYVDQQKLKLQESPEVVPTGEMPRNIMLTVERYIEIYMSMDVCMYECMYTYSRTYRIRIYISMH